MRWSQKRGVRKRAAADARRYAKYLRERDTELAEAGEPPARARSRLYPGPRAAVDAAGQAPERLGAAARPPRLPRTSASARARCRSTAEVELDLGMNPLAEYQAQSLQEARKLVERRRRCAVSRSSSTSRDRRLPSPAIASPRSWARTLMNQLAAWRAPHDLRVLTAFEPEEADAWEWGKWLPHQRVDPNVPGRFLIAARWASSTRCSRPSCAHGSSSCAGSPRPT